MRMNACLAFPKVVAWAVGEAGRGASVRRTFLPYFVGAHQIHRSKGSSAFFLAVSRHLLSAAPRRRGLLSHPLFVQMHPPHILGHDRLMSCGCLASQGKLFREFLSWVFGEKGAGHGGLASRSLLSRHCTLSLLAPFISLVRRKRNAGSWPIESWSPFTMPPHGSTSVDFRVNAACTVRNPCRGQRRGAWPVRGAETRVASDQGEESSGGNLRSFVLAAPSPKQKKDVIHHN